MTPIPEGISNPKEGDDLTEALDIVKYEPPIPAQLAGKIKGTFPSFIPKTDEIRIQNFESEVGFSPVGERAYVTEKLDGTSFTCYFNNGVFGVCGRNWELSETDDNSLWRMAKVLELKDKMTKHGKNIALQGELIGAGQVTVQAATSGTTTVVSTGATPATPKCRAQYSAITLIKRDTDSWYAVGDIA